jgi:prolyl-tRNA synthetase
VGHIFQLGQKYSEAFDLRLQDETGRLRLVTMGSYGVGVSRALGVIAEQRCDERGLIWPASIAPAAVHVLSAGGSDGDQQRAARSIVDKLERVDVTCLLDDRADTSFGRRLADAELIGAPIILIVGRGLATGVVELRNRHTGSVEEVATDHVVACVMGLLGAAG